MVTVPVYCGIFRAALGGCDSGLHLAGHTRAGKPERHLQMKMDPPQFMVRPAHHERAISRAAKRSIPAFSGGLLGGAAPRQIY